MQNLINNLTDVHLKKAHYIFDLFLLSLVAGDFVARRESSFAAASQGEIQHKMIQKQAWEVPGTYVLGKENIAQALDRSALTRVCVSLMSLLTVPGTIQVGHGD